jgi:hypothetical protein
MSKRFIQLTSGWIPVAVMLLLAAALVSGAPREDRVDGTPAVPATPELPINLLDSATGAHAENVTLVLRSFVEMPSEVSLNRDAKILPPGGELEAVRFRNLPGAGK